MSLDVSAEVVIHRPKAEVAAFAMDWSNDPVWIGGVVEAEPLTDAPLAEGIRVRRVARFLAKRIEYVNEVTKHDPASFLEMRSVKGPFPMTIRYEFEPAADGTLARIRIRGEATGFFKLAGSVLAAAVRRSVVNDLKTLKQLLESGAGKSL